MHKYLFHRPLPTIEGLEDYEQRYLSPLRNQLEQVKKTGSILSEMSRPGIGKRGLEQILTATSDSVDSLFTTVCDAKEHLNDESSAPVTRVNDVRRLKSLLENVSSLFYQSSTISF